MAKNKKSMDGNSAATHVAYALSEVCAIYPITPSSSMAELADEWSSKGRKNIFGKEAVVVEMQSEAGAAGTLHGALSAGALGTTFTASQGLLLMIPNMYKMAGELLPAVFHVAARALAGQALSIFGDHQDVMAARSTGVCILASASVQEVMDLALIAHLAAIKSSLPFLHFFDGFRTSHEIQKIEVIDYNDIKNLVDNAALENLRKRALNPNKPYVKVGGQNPDIYFQSMEALNPFYQKVPEIVKEQFDLLFKLTGRKYNFFDYYGAKDADRIIIAMGSGLETIEETVDYLNGKKEKVGVLKVRLFRPFVMDEFLKAIPASAQKIAVLDRTKEPTSIAEPLYLDVCTSFQNAKDNRTIVGGRYGLGSKEFTPSMVKAVFDNLKLENPKNHFTVGIVDDVTHTSLDVKEDLNTEAKDVVCCKFWGMGGDGTIGANKDAIKIIGDNTEKNVQGYFAYDSKKTSGYTISHLRFGDSKIRSTYEITNADYIACHHPAYVNRYDLIKGIKKGGIFVLNCPWSEKEIEEKIPAEMKRKIAEKEVKFYIINANDLAAKLGLEMRINMIMQTIFFSLSKILPIDEAIKLLKDAIEKTYAKKGDAVVNMNKNAVDSALKELKEIKYPSSWKEAPLKEREVDMSRPEFIKEVVDVLSALEGDVLPVSKFTRAGVFPMGTSKYEKRGLATQVSTWIPENCIQCNQCSFVCPHAAIRPFLLTDEEVKNAPEGLKVLKPLGKGMENLHFCIAITPYDCTGCTNCVIVCPAPKGKALQMKPIEEVKQINGKLWDYLINLPSREGVMGKFTLKGSQFKKPLFEFSGACAGCGETPYIKLLTQLYGSRMIIANATGCTSIYGAYPPSVPYTVDEKGRGPAWANSLFEDNAEYGFGIHLGETYRRHSLKILVEQVITANISDELKEVFSEWLKNFDEGENTQIFADKVIEKLEKEKDKNEILKDIYKQKDLLIKPSIWCLGGDGWAYDIGYGGLDHVLALGHDMNILVLDTEVYSNTGGQSSKATPLSAIAKFAAAGKRTFKKDLALMAMTYGNVYVAAISMGSDKMQVLRAFQEAESYKGPSLIIAFSPCIAHGLKCGMSGSQTEEKEAVESGYWVNFRYDPRLKEQGKNPFILDSKDPTLDVEKFISNQIRYDYLKKSHPEDADRLHKELSDHLKEKLKFYKKMAEKKEQ
ncbi:MAG: pyruvate:ferredoxin (flavodoxin) oxidoreductase [Parachlamydiales bacterium]|nr:pyruvate:ferredoxin (flavodoxin) oxidoreductase [Parachlamydiales bacterium]